MGGKLSKRAGWAPGRSQTCQSVPDALQAQLAVAAFDALAGRALGSPAPPDVAVVMLRLLAQTFSLPAGGGALGDVPRKPRDFLPWVVAPPYSLVIPLADDDCVRSAVAMGGATHVTVDGVATSAVDVSLLCRGCRSADITNRLLVTPAAVWEALARVLEASDPTKLETLTLRVSRRAGVVELPAEARDRLAPLLRRARGTLHRVALPDTYVPAAALEGLAAAAGGPIVQPMSELDFREARLEDILRTVAEMSKMAEEHTAVV